MLKTRWAILLVLAFTLSVLPVLAGAGQRNCDLPEQAADAARKNCPPPDNTTDDNDQDNETPQPDIVETQVPAPDVEPVRDVPAQSNRPAHAGQPDHAGQPQGTPQPQQTERNAPPNGAGCHGLANALTNIASPQGWQSVYEQYTRRNCPATTDLDGDGIIDVNDNCMFVANPDQTDVDGDGIGDACDKLIDRDGDGIADDADNCPDTPNADQTDSDGDGLGDACDDLEPPLDSDGDGVADDVDNCPNTPNTDQADSDGDGLGDACDDLEPPLDSDGDSVADDIDNCPNTPNTNQADSDGDGVGDVCDPDIDGDNYDNDVDCAPYDPAINPGAVEIPDDGIDNDCDGVVDVIISGGEFQTTLTWDSNDDYDLYVTDPLGDTVFWANPSVPSGGQLDADAVPSCSLAPQQSVENIYWPENGAPEGTYTIRVDLARDCDDGSAAWTLVVRMDGVVVLEETGIGVAIFEVSDND